MFNRARVLDIDNEKHVASLWLYKHTINNLPAKEEKRNRKEILSKQDYQLKQYIPRKQPQEMKIVDH